MALVTLDGLVDVESASLGLFDSNPNRVFERWDEFREWAAGVAPGGQQFSDQSLGAPSPCPRQVFAIGLNYADHAAESGVAVPLDPLTFTKFPSSITGPNQSLRLPSGNVDWEAELVVVIGRSAKDVRAADAWSHVAGFTVGQDFSERVVQMQGSAPQFSLGKSFPGFGPTGPALVTVDELPDPGNLKIECVINGEIMQSSSTSNLVFSVPELISRLSAVCELLPGDLIFSGTPGGVGVSRKPMRYLIPGDQVVTSIEGIGEIRQVCVDGQR